LKLADGQRRLQEAEELLQTHIAARQQAEESLQHEQDNLEVRMLERTAELESARAMAEAAHQRLYGVLETLPVYVALLSEDYRVPFANRFFRSRFGDSQGRHCFEYLFCRTAPCENCESFKVMQTGQPHRWEWLGPDGRTYDIFDFPFTDANGARMIMEVGVDITEPRQAQEELRRHRDNLEILVAERTWELDRSEKRHRSYIEMTGQLGWTTDVNGRVTEDIPAWRRFTGQSKEEVKEAGWTRALHPDDREEAERTWKNAVATGDRYEVEYRLRRYDGVYRTFLARGVPVFKDDGSVLEWVGTCIDITEHKRGEEALRENERRLNHAQRIAHLGSWELDVVNNRLSWSDEVYRIFGAQPQEFTATYETFLAAVHPEDRYAVDAAYSNSVRGGQAGYEIEHRIVRKATGEIRTVQERCNHIRDASGRIVRSVGMVHDITERKEMEEELVKAHDMLEQQVEERTAELRTALTEVKALKDRLEAENIYFRQEIKLHHQHAAILGQSEALRYALYRAEQVAPTTTTCLILGETGTGKELFAFAIHDMSPRKERSMITVNCAALPANLIESELFGREKGAFTGADTRQVGRFEVANGSTLCLDEIGEMPLELQAKLLRVIQHHEFERLGSSCTVKVDVRIIATTNRDLEAEVRKGRFRQDLYYRLNVFPITVPPLRQRKDDIPIMVRAFVERLSRKMGKQIDSIPRDMMQVLIDYSWPGNVRELESVIERAVILAPGSVLQLADNLEISPPVLSAATKTLVETERNHILRILADTGWRIEGKEGAASILGLHPSTLRARMHKLGIVRPGRGETD